MDLNTIGSIASLIGLLGSVIVALHQHRQAVAARLEAQAERNRSASLEDHLTRQRWQQLRSIAEQIDTIEATGRKEYVPAEAALHARLKEQFASLLGVIATSTKPYDPETVRHWIEVGRLRRPWQIAEAVSHLEASRDPKTEESLRNLLKSESAIPPPRSLKAPQKPSSHVAAYILLGHHFQDEIRSTFPIRGQVGRSLTVLLDLLARDSVESASLDGVKSYKCWGGASQEPFVERFDHYQKQDFWIVAEACDAIVEKIRPFAHLFEPYEYMLIPTKEAVEMVRALYPELPSQMGKICRASKAA